MSPKKSACEKTGRTGLCFRLFALAVMSWSSAALADYKVMPGDILHMSAPGLPELETKAMVDMDGVVRFPLVGKIPVQGLTLDEIEDRARALGQSKSYKRYAQDGSEIYISLADNEIVIDMAEWRPVYVAGDVLRPGEIVFRPGLTVRSAIAAAGDVSMTTSARPVSDDPRSEVRVKGLYQEASIEVARLRGDIWRMKAELDGSDLPPPPDRALFPVDDAEYQSILSANERQFQVDRAQLAGAERFYAASAEQYDQRLGILAEASKNDQTTVKEDNIEFSRVKSLLDKRLVPIDRLSDIRRSQLISVTRLLETDDSLAKARLERTKLEHDRDDLIADRQSQLASSLATSEQKLGAALARQTALGRELLLLGGSTAPFDRPVVELSIRSEGDAPNPANMSDTLAPGDVVEVRISSGTDAPPRVADRGPEQAGH